VAVVCGDGRGVWWSWSWSRRVVGDGETVVVVVLPPHHGVVVVACGGVVSSVNK